MRAFERATSPERLAKDFAFLLEPDQYVTLRTSSDGLHRIAETVWVYKVPGEFL